MNTDMISLLPRSPFDSRHSVAHEMYQKLVSSTARIPSSVKAKPLDVDEMSLCFARRTLSS
jgi:hypothetical protein